MAEPIDPNAEWSPRMPPGPKQAVDRVSMRTRKLETASRLRKAAVGADGILFYDGGALYFQDSPDDTTPGKIFADFAEDAQGLHYLRIYAPFVDGGDELANTITLQGDHEDSGPKAGNIWLYSDGYIQLITQTGDPPIPQGGVIISTPELGLIGIPTTSNPANLYLGMVGGKLTVAEVTSSEQYKTNIESAQIEPAEVLQLVPKTWVDKADVDASGSMVPKHPTMPNDITDETEMVAFVAPQQVGFIAEDLEALPSMRQFVRHNADGEPDGIAYDRLTVPLLELCKAQQSQIDSLTERLSALEATVKLHPKGGPTK